MTIPEVDINYIRILEYLEENQGISYSNPEKLFGEEKERMLTIRTKGQNVIKEMEKIAEQAKILYGLDEYTSASWLDGSRIKTKKYLWIQMKYKHNNGNPISVSIFVEKENKDKAYFRISLEVKNNGTDKAVIEQYHKYFEIPQKAGLVYVTGSNEWEISKVLNETQNIIISKIESGIYKKVQICKFIKYQKGKSNSEYHQEIMEAIGEILPYYNYVLEKDKFIEEKRGWLLTWNPVKWNWKEYEEWCIGTKKGETYTVPWTCYNALPKLGDDIFLMRVEKYLKGIVAHGLVTKESYKELNDSPEKAEESIIHIDITFDLIQNVNFEEILLQDNLKRKYLQQIWNSTEPEIEIKEPILKGLKEEWNNLIDRNDDFCLHLMSIILRLVRKNGSSLLMKLKS